MGLIETNIFCKSTMLEDNTITYLEKNKIIKNLEKLNYKVSEKNPFGLSYTKKNFSTELINDRYVNLLIKTNKLDIESLEKIICEYKSLTTDDFNTNYLLLRIEEDINIDDIQSLEEFNEYNIKVKKYSFTNKKLLTLTPKIIYNKFKFELSNKKEAYLTTTNTKEEMKELISNDKWIKLSLYHYYRTDLKDIQTCNIVSIIEYDNFFIDLISEKEKLVERLFLAQEIEKFKFNFKMKLWLHKHTYWSYIDRSYELYFQAFYKEFLLLILQKCTEYNCKYK